MKNNVVPGWLINIIGILLIILIVLVSMNQFHALKCSSQTMNVSATGKVTVVPDLATITLGVISEGASAIEVKDKNNQKINQVLAFIKQQNIDAKDIQTSGFYASPKYNYTDGQNNMVGFQANQTVTIKIRHIDKSTAQLEKIVDGVINNGANQIQGISFSFADPEQMNQVVRKQAIDKAKHKAEEIAAEAGIRLGRVVNVIESEGNSFMPKAYAAVNLAAHAQSTAPDIEAGSQDITETVTVVFEVD